MTKLHRNKAWPVMAFVVLAPWASQGRVDIAVGVSNGRITAPDTVSPGWSRIRVDEAGDGHIPVVFRIDAKATGAALPALLAALDTAPVTPTGLLALGGPEVGNSGEVVIRLTPGAYVIACLIRGPDGHRHVHRGESKVMIVRNGRPNAAHAAAPKAGNTVRMVDFAYTGEETWSAGSRFLRVENNGRQDHQLRIVRLRENSTMKDWVEADRPGQHGTAVVGMARIGPGQVAYLPIELPPGSYVLNCLVTDPRTKRQHIELGMYRAIRVR